jgi:hypothetical protein
MLIEGRLQHGGGHFTRGKNGRPGYILTQGPLTRNLSSLHLV